MVGTENSRAKQKFAPREREGVRHCERKRSNPGRLAMAMRPFWIASTYALRASVDSNPPKLAKRAQGGVAIAPRNDEKRGAKGKGKGRVNEKIMPLSPKRLGGNLMTNAMPSRATALPVTEETIAARLERLPYSGWHITITAVLGVAIFFDSFDSLAIAYVLPVLVREWHIPPAHIGLLISSANFGQALGALTFGLIAERIGRVSTARIAIGIFAVMSLACAFTHNYDQLIVCRFLQGIGLGGEIPVASTYISEILRADRRGGRFLTYQVIFPVGLLMSGIAGASVVPRFGWQWMFHPGHRRAGDAALLSGIAALARRERPSQPSRRHHDRDRRRRLAAWRETIAAGARTGGEAAR
jgi:Major Facilitator Superfamily